MDVMDTTEHSDRFGRFVVDADADDRATLQDLELWRRNVFDRDFQLGWRLVQGRTGRDEENGEETEYFYVLTIAINQAGASLPYRLSVSSRSRWIWASYSK